MVDSHEGEKAMNDIHDLSIARDDEQDDNIDHQSDSRELIYQLGRDLTINCLLRCSRADYGVIATLNQNFRTLIRSGELYKLRQKMGIVEHWVYFSCNLSQWEAFDPTRGRWMRLPKMPSNDTFMWSDKESLAVGTELLVFGKEIMSQVIYKYSILTNMWTSGMKMNTPRCLFGSSSCGEIAILAGGCDLDGKILSSAELYNSGTETWNVLPSMNKARKMCSAVFMDGKFYVIGGIGKGNKPLMSAEVFDPQTNSWREIPNLFPLRPGGAGTNEATVASEAPPLIAVVNDQLYAADYVHKDIMKYDKEKSVWIVIGKLPKQTASMNGWGLAFKACGDRLIVIGGPRSLGTGSIDLHSWMPGNGPPQWNLMARKQSGSFVYNCAVMGC